MAVVIAVSWALVGVLGGHAFTYALLYSDAHRHDEVLAQTGHAWLGLMWPMLLIGVIIAATMGLLSGTSRGRSRGVSFVVLATLQICLFAGIELTERAATGLTADSLSHELFGHGLVMILIVGSLLQVVTAWLGSAASRIVGAVAQRLRSATTPRRSNQTVLRPVSMPVPRGVYFRWSGIRGPPLTPIA